MVFEKHFDMAEKYNLPMFFHNRDGGEDFLGISLNKNFCKISLIDIVEKHRKKFSSGVVHSFAGT